MQAWVMEVLPAKGYFHDPDLLHQFQEFGQLDENIREKARILLEVDLTQL